MPNKEGKPIPADLPAGHQRDELTRKIADELTAAREDMPEQPIDPTKFKHIDNEVAQGWEIQKKAEREAGLKALSISADDMNRAGVSNPVPGYYYKWVNHEDCYTTNEARAAVRKSLEFLAGKHFFPVTDAHDTRVASEFKRDGGLRRWGDLVLWAIHFDDFKKVQREARELQARLGAVEENYVNTSQHLLRTQGRGAGVAYDQNNPRMARYMGAEKMQPFTAQVITEEK